MFRKVVKIVLVALMLLGAAIAFSNLMNTEVHANAAGKWVHYDPDTPNCLGLGDTCFDMT